LKPRRTLAASLLLLCLLAFAVARHRSRPSAPAAADRSLVSPVVASLTELRPVPATARPNREGEGDSRIESRYSEAEILELIAEAERLPADPDVQVLGDGLGGLDFSLGTSFDSIDVSDCCLSGTLNPPDPELAVGRDHVVAVVNSSLEIYDKTGTSLLGPLDFETFFSVLGLGCTIFPFDPNALYDESADRYVIAADGNGTEYCVAVSQTGDATGAYNFYAFPVDVNNEFFDYPHAGVGVDAIYVGANMFGAGNGRVFAFDKAAMYSGAPAASANHATGSDDTPQPMNIKGAFPVAGPHSIITSRSGAGLFQLYSWDDPFGADTFTSVTTLNVPAAHGVTVGFGVSSQQSGGGSIGSIDPRPLDFEYRDGFAWMTNLVSCNPGAGTVNCVQWAQIDVGAASIEQAGVFATDGEYRIFPDLAVDGCGNMLVGYTKTTAAIFPAVWVAGRKAGDPPGTIQGELEIKAGEVSFGESRWGDYSGMTVDPDGVTFWYLGEYSKNTVSTRNWGNFIGSVRFDDCVASTIFADGFESADTSRWPTTVP
jgi:hypothetical protein